MPEKPNILLITTDQQRFDALHYAGNPSIRTPHLNWLAETGVHFTRCYSDAPLCVPARATMITGQHAFNLAKRVSLWTRTAPDDHLTLPGLMTAAGYQTRAIGKMHYHPSRKNYGWEHVEILEDYYRQMAKTPQHGVPMNHGLGQNEMEPAISTVDESHSLTHWTVDRSIDFLETRDESRPFFLYTSFAKPHPPFDPCQNYWALYANEKVPDPVTGDWSETAEDVPPGFMERTWNLNGADKFSPEMIRACKRAYYACVTQIDYNLGLLFARLREMDLLENTLIIFTSDHGEMMGDHHMGAKSTFFEGSAHVPMIVRPGAELEFPRERLGGQSPALTCLADIMPTILAAAEVEPPADLPMDGIDMLAAAREEVNRPILHGECDDYHMVLEWPYKYHFCMAGGAELLFNLEEDPMEQENLLEDDDHSEVAGDMREELIKRLERDGNPSVRDGQFVALKKAPTRREVRLNCWPGFHSRADTYTDVLH